MCCRAGANAKTLINVYLPEKVTAMHKRNFFNNN